MQLRYAAQSNAMDFRPETLQFVAEDDGVAVWGSIPDGTTATVAISDSSGLTILTQEHSDGSGVVTIYEDGFVDIAVPVSQMTALRGGMYAVTLTIEMDGYTTQIYGMLPIYESGKPWL